MKIDRLLTMTVLLLNRGRISASELAERFEVSTKTIYRDMDTLSRAGIPVMAHQGISGGFEIMEQYTISRHFLSREEITSILTAVKGMRTVIDDAAATRLQEKVEALLLKSDKLLIDRYGEEIVLDLNPWSQSPAAREKISRIKLAIKELHIVTFKYLNMNGTETVRPVEPTALILKGNTWYLQGYCRLREQFRVFRLSRIQELEVLAERFERRQPPVMEGYEWNTEWIQQEEAEVVLSFRQQARYRVYDAFHPDQIELQEDGGLRVRRAYVLDDWFYGMLLSYGDNVKVEHPAFVAEQHVIRAQKIIGLYKN